MTEPTADKTQVKPEWAQPVPGYPLAFDPWANPADCLFHEDVAERVCHYWETHFTLKDGKFDGQPFILADWERPIIGHVFAWKRPDGTRRFRNVFIYVPKKSGKSELGAGICLIMLDADGEKQAEVFSCASDTDQGRIVFDAGKLMVERNEKLRARIRVRASTRRMLAMRTGGIWRVLSSRVESKHGPNVHCLVIDELHTQKDGELVGTLEAGTVSRRQPLIVKLTTADHAGESPCNKELDYARRVLRGETPDAYYFPVVYDGQSDYEADPNCWKDPEWWGKVNPGLGVSVRRDFLRSEVAKSADDPAREERVKRLHFNIQTSRLQRWLAQDDWDACGQNDVRTEGPCYGGLDLGSTDDLTALVLHWPETDSIRAWHFVPEDTYNQREEYKLWKEHGAALDVTPGRTFDDAYVEAKILALKEQHDIHGIGYDRWNATDLVRRLEDKHGVPMIEMGQGYQSMSMPSQEFFKDVKSHRLAHDNDPVLNWEAGNVEIMVGPSGAIKPVKAKPWSPKKVDGIIAAVIAKAQSLAEHEEEPGQCGIIVF